MNLRLVEKARTLINAVRVAEEFTSPVGDGGDDVLRSSLESCISSLSLIPDELEKARELAASAQSTIERDAYLWQGDVARLQIEQAARVATDRLRLLDSLKSEEDLERERAACADTLYWFRMYAWGYDPRAPLKVQPFYPFPRQEEYIAWLDDTVMRRRTSGVVEKARDFGVTVGALDWCAHKWLFVPLFSAFLVSSTEDLVDSTRDPDTLFEKIRFQLRLTPSWMLPRGFDLRRDMPYMHISNPETGATIGGGAPTENVGRQRRRTVVIADEFQGWPGGGFKQNTALSQTSPSVVKLGTPSGTLNQYYRDTHAQGANVFVMDWKDHPWKDQRWYDSLPFGYISTRMTPEEIAQEVDRSYTASQPGRVWPPSVYKETHTVVTVSELRAFYARHGVATPDSGDGRARLPLGFGLGRANDKGHTEGHRNAWLWCGVPKEGMPLDDSVFIHREWLAPLGSSHKDRAETVLEFEKPDGETPRADSFSLNSHEAQGDRDTYKDYGLILRKWTVDYQDGIDEITDRFTLKDLHKPHPIRPELMGRPTIYIVVADGEGELLQKASGEYYVKAARSMLGMVNLRRQIERYHYPPEEEGKPVGQMRPRKIDDDLIDDLRAFATHRWPPKPLMTEAERRELRLRPELRAGAIAQIPDALQQQAAIQSRALHLARMEGEAQREEERARRMAVPRVRFRRL